MYDTRDLAAAVRLAAANLTAAAAAVGRVLESVADSLEPDAEQPSAPRPAAKTRKPTATASSARTRTKSAPGKRAPNSARGRRPSA